MFHSYVSLPEGNPFPSIPISVVQVPSRSTTLNSSPFWNCWTKILDHESCCEVALCPAQDLFNHQMNQMTRYFNVTSTSSCLNKRRNNVISKCLKVLLCSPWPWHDETLSTELFVDGCHVENGGLVLAYCENGDEWFLFQTHWVFLLCCIYFPRPIQLSPINRWTWETPDPTWHT